MDEVLVYIASKVHRAQAWRDVNATKGWGLNVTINARWLDEVDVHLQREHELGEDFLSAVWKRNALDVLVCDALVVYADATDALRGTLVEVGMALAYDTPVIACGPTVGEHHTPQWGSWQFHPLVTRIKSPHEIPKALRLVLPGRIVG